MINHPPTTLQTTFTGQLIRPGDPDYDQARRVWNGMIDRYPALIARCATTEDVVTAVNYARDNNLLLSVRGGGHNVAGHGTNDGGLVIDLSLINQVTVDPAEQIVHAGGGATIAQLDAETQKHGLAVPMGVVSVTGIAGLTLGGGYGWLRSKHGLSCDNLRAATVVTADGRIIHTSADQHPDLLWALRGGGGNFGIVTEFIYEAHRVGPNVSFLFAIHDAEGDNMAEVIRFYRDFSESAPDEISTVLSIGIVPPEEEVFPAEIHGRRMAIILGMYAGSPAIGEDALMPLRTLNGRTQPMLDFSGTMSYTDIQTMFDEDYPDGLRYYWKSLNLFQLDEDGITTIVKHAHQQPSPMSTIDIWHIGGAVKQVSPDKSAFHGRDANYLLNPEANWEHSADDHANTRWVNNLLAEMRPYSDGSRYLNFAGMEEGQDSMVQYAFGQQYARLAAVKQTYDPHNLFRLNANIKPK